jgi:hypothetical protein
MIRKAIQDKKLPPDCKDFHFCKSPFNFAMRVRHSRRGAHAQEPVRARNSSARSLQSQRMSVGIVLAENVLAGVSGCSHRFSLETDF